MAIQVSFPNTVGAHPHDWGAEGGLTNQVKFHAHALSGVDREGDVVKYILFGGGGFLLKRYQFRKEKKHCCLLNLFSRKFGRLGGRDVVIQGQTVLQLYDALTSICWTNE